MDRGDPAPGPGDDGAPGEDETPEPVEELPDPADAQVRHDMNVANDWHPPD